jgi:hypothetical protein
VIGLGPKGVRSGVVKLLHFHAPPRLTQRGGPRDGGELQRKAGLKGALMMLSASRFASVMMISMTRLLLLLLPVAALASFTPPLPLVALSKKLKIDVLPLQHLVSPINLNVVCLGCAGDGNQIFVSESAVRVWLQRALARTHVVRATQ